MTSYNLLMAEPSGLLPQTTSTPQVLSSGIRDAPLDVVRVPAFSAVDWLLHGLSTRTGGATTVYRPEQDVGDLNLGFTASDSADNVRLNRERFFAEITGNAHFPAVTLRQIHSAIALRIGAADAAPQAIHKADGMMTNEPGVLLAIQTADCIPVLIADPKRRAIAAFHAGWRGTVKRIVEKGVGHMRMEFGTQPEDCLAAIGPGIGPCCYAVGEEVHDEFASQFAYAGELFREVYSSDPIKEKYPLLFMTARAPGHSALGPQLHLDLIEANRRQLLDAGLAPEAISTVGDCTGCNTDRYFSYRSEQGFTGRMFSAIGIQP